MTDKLTAAMWDELAEAHAEAGHEYDPITRACRRRGDEAARREAGETKPDALEGHLEHALNTMPESAERFARLVETLGEPAPAPDERAKLVAALRSDRLEFNEMFAEAGDQIELDGERIAELERERDAERKRYDDLVDGFWRIVDSAKLRDGVPSCELNALQRIVNRLEEAEAAGARAGELAAALKEAVDQFDGMCDDEINEALLPRLRNALATEGRADG